MRFDSCKRKRVHVLFEHDTAGRPHSTAYIRLLKPLSLIQLTADIEITAGLGIPSDHVDILIVDRLWRGWGSEREVIALLDLIRAKGAKLVHALDDALYDLDKEPALWGYPSHAVVRLSSEADCVVVTTNNLSNRAKFINDNVVVVENVIDPSFFQSGNMTVENREKFVIGYMGSYTHMEDIRMVSSALRIFSRQHEAPVEIQVIGGGDKSRLAELLGPTFKGIDPPVATDYPDFFRWMVREVNWDVGIAPLQSNSFNEYKSDIKWLDYTALGIPGIYSDVPAYRGTIASGRNGVLADSSVDSWLNAFQSLAASAALRKSIVDDARSTIFESRLLTHAAAKWQSLLNDL